MGGRIAGSPPDVEEEPRVDAAIAHRGVQRPEKVGAVVEAVAGDQHGPGGTVEELADDDGGVARECASRFGARPHEVHLGDGTLGALGYRDIENGFDGGPVEVGDRAEDRPGDVGQTGALQRDLAERAGQAPGSNVVNEDA